MIIRSWGVTSEIISADLSCTKTFTQNIPVFKLLVMRHSPWMLIFAWDFINSLCVGTELLWKRYHLQWLSYLYVRRHWKRKRNEMKRNLYVSQINFCHDLQPAYGGLSFEYVSTHVPILESLSISQSKFQIRLYSEELKCLRYFMSILSATFLLLYGHESSQIVCTETIYIKWSDQINVTSFQKRN